MTAGGVPAAREDGALALHEASLVVDLHTDSLIAARGLGRDLSRRHRPPRGVRPWMLHADIPRLREGGVDAVFLGIVTHPWPRHAWERALARIRYCRYVVEKNSADLALAVSPDDIDEARRAGKIAVLIGVEGMHMLGGRLERIGELHALGARYITMAHFTSNRFAVSSADTRKKGVRLSELGCMAVEEMNRLGIMIDLAHTHTRLISEVCRRSEAPVMVSHGAVQALRPAFRNLSDDDVTAVASTGGVIGLIFATHWLVEKGEGATLDTVVDHADHVRRLVGVDHLALGSDWDGLIATPLGMRDAADLPELTRAFLRRGYSDDDVEKILGQNFMRAFREASR